MTDVWDFWRRARANPKAIGSPELRLYVDTPEVGYWRYLSKRLGHWVPVAFWMDEDGILRAVEDGREVEATKMGDLWHRVCRHPISYDQYMAAAEGNGFADEPPAPLSTSGLGHNLSLDLAEQLKLEFEADAEIANNLLNREITSQDIADQIAIMAARLSKIRGRADDEHDREKRPHLEAGRAVDDRWRELREGVTELVTLLKKRLQPWLDSHDSSAGRTGARVSLRRAYVGEIVNVELFFGAVKDRPEVRDSLQKVANQLAKAHVETPGLEIREEARAI